MKVNIVLLKKLRTQTGAAISDCKQALISCKNNLDHAWTWLREQGIAKAAEKITNPTTKGKIIIRKHNNKLILLEISTQTDFVVQNSKFHNLVEQISKIILLAPISDASKIDNILKLTDQQNNSIENILKENIAIFGENIIISKMEILQKKLKQQFGFYLHNNKEIGAAIILDHQITQEIADELAMQVVATNCKFISRNNISREYIKKENDILIKQLNNNPQLVNKPEQIKQQIINGKLEKILNQNCLLMQPLITNEEISINDLLKKYNCSIIKIVYFKIGEPVKVMINNKNTI